MSKADRWLLPDGIEESLPAEAHRIEQLRRQLLDLYQCWGYSFVIPPLVEFTESLLIGLGRDLDLATFKVTDQLSGKMLGIRADITPQTARMDAHSLRKEGVNRLCYAGPVLHTKARSPLATRSPLLSGVELYGDEALGADIEVVSLLLEVMQVCGLSDAVVEIGHVGIYRALIAAAQLNEDEKETLFDLIQRKAAAEMQQWVQTHISEKALADILCGLPRLAGDRQILVKAKALLAKAPESVLEAVESLEKLADAISQRYPQARLYFDLSELHGRHYHTGLVFAAFVNGYGRALATGGRYDDVGKVFGRARPATGFHVDVSAVTKLTATSDPIPPGIFAPLCDDPKQWQVIQQLRQAGERVVNGLQLNDDPKSHHCDRQLQNLDGEYQVVSI